MLLPWQHCSCNPSTEGNSCLQVHCEFKQDMELLRCLPPSAEPRATEYVSQMVQTVGSIIEAGHAYEAQGSVWFSVESVDGYGRLSGRSLVSDTATCNGLHAATVRKRLPGSPLCLPMRLAGGQSSRRARGGERIETQPLRLCAVEGRKARGANLGQSLGPGTSGVAH